MKLQDFKAGKDHILINSIQLKNMVPQSLQSTQWVNDNVRKQPEV